MKKTTFLSIFLCVAGAFTTSVSAYTYTGRVVDEAGLGIGYATVYPTSDPVAGTATNMDGYFQIETDSLSTSKVIISYIGYEKQTLPLAVLDSAIIVLREQPIALETTVVSAKASKQKNKRKKMAALLHQVYNKMAEDFGTEPYKQRVVSDVRMESERETWGVEQMIAEVVTLPEIAKDTRDSIQFKPEYCKRYFSQELRRRADTILAGNTLETFDTSKGSKMDYRKAANAVDSGVVTHKALWAMGNIRYDYMSSANEIKKWTVSNESEGETVLTHTDKHNYLGIFKFEFKKNYILDSETLSVRRFSEQAEAWISIPFGYKLNKEQLVLLNMFNMGEKEIEKFRIRRAHMLVSLNTIYQWRNGHIYPLEKNLHSQAEIEGTKKEEFPVEVWATQRAIQLQTEGVRPMKSAEMKNRIERQIVEIY